MYYFFDWPCFWIWGDFVKRSVAESLQISIMMAAEFDQFFHGTKSPSFNDSKALHIADA